MATSTYEEKITSRATVSAVVFTYNNASPLLKQVLEHVQWADEIIVVDMDSSDGTLNLCKEFTSKIFRHNENENINKNFNFGYEQAASDYVLHISSDFLISPELKREILNVLSLPENERQDIYEAHMINYFFGKPVQLSIWEQTKIPLLFKKGSIRYPTYRIETWAELLSVRRGLFKNKIHHYTVERIADLVKKYNRYSDIEIRNNPEVIPLIRNPVLLGLSGLGNAFYNFFFRGGFKYGMHGFIVCALQGFYYFLLRAKRWERYEVEKEKGIWNPKLQSYDGDSK